MVESVKISNRKRAFLNNNRELICYTCNRDLRGIWVVSRPNGKHDCRACAIRLKIVLKSELPCGSFS